MWEIRLKREKKDLKGLVEATVGSELLDEKL
jgi:hypothetical protein